MSFTSDVKNEMLKYWHKKGCCRFYFTLGLATFASSYTKQNVSLKTENENVALNFRKMLMKCFNISCDIKISSKGIYTAKLPKNEIELLHEKLEINDELQDLFTCENCATAFIRGAFLSGGRISDPKKEYHLEFAIKDEAMSFTLCKILVSLGFDAKTTERSSSFVVYIKDSENIEDLLTLMSATKASLFLMETKILKEIRNNINRKNNFETANISKSSASSARVIRSITLLEENGIISTLPTDLQEIAFARQENFEMSLNELGDLFGLSRSGVYHRLKKIEEIADKYR